LGREELADPLARPERVRDHRVRLIGQPAVDQRQPRNVGVHELT